MHPIPEVPMQAGEFAWLASKLSASFRLDREIGRGGWGVVFLAEELRHHRAVAIKVMHPDTAGHLARGRFLREIAVEAQLSHPHIVPLFDSGEVDGLPYCVMPYIEGESLQQRITREGPLPIGDALRIARQVAEALAHAHGQGVVHRDIKPANILLAGANALVADFGIARAINVSVTDVERTASGVQLGSPTYMAPEQAAGDPAVDGRADIYGLGCVLFEMLAGRPPFEASNPASLLARHALDPVPPLRTVRPTVSPALQGIVERALSKVPADRHPTAEALHDALEAVAHEESWSGSHALRVSRQRSLRRVVVVTGLGVATVAAGLAVTTRQRAAARAVAAVDTTRILVVPFEGPMGPATAAEEQLRRAISQWSGVTPVDRFLVRERTVDAPLSTEDSRALARQLRAGRFIRGVVTADGEEREVRAVLYDVRGGNEALMEVSERFGGDAGRRDSAFARIAERLLVRQAVPRSADASSAGTRSLPALQGYLRAHTAIERWDLADAESALDSAWHADAGFGEAALWLALVRDWAGKPTSSWRAVAVAAAADSQRLGVRGRTMARAMVASAGGDVVRACRLWDDLTKRAPFDFAAWYGLALCLDHDHLVVRDSRSASGWRFRSSYQSALLAYLRAFERLPSIHRALADDAFARVRGLLQVGANVRRTGMTADSARFLANASLDGDTIAFVPYPAAAVQRASLGTVRTERSTRLVMARQRELFRDIAIAWVSAEPQGAVAREAMALALQLLGDPSALDTLARASQLARTGAERRRLAEARVWMQLKFALPDDRRLLRRARELADSLLRLPADGAPAPGMASIAALNGRISLVQQSVRRGQTSVDAKLPAGVGTAATQLSLLASFGAPADSLRRMERRVGELINVLVPSEGRADARALALSRAARMAWPDAALACITSDTWTADYLLPALAASSRRDTARVRIAVDALRRLRDFVPPAQVSFDAVLPEAALLRRAGHADVAAAWLEQSLAALRVSQPNSDPIYAATLVRAMVLRADLALQAGDRETARRWAGAVVELWADADAPLQPTVQRMRTMLTR